MTIDDLGRAAGSAARSKASQEVEPAMMLRQLRRTHRTRNVLAISAGVVAFAVAAVFLVHILDTSRPLQPGSPPTPAPSASCPQGVSCLGAGRYRIDMTVPMTVTLPSGYQGAFRQFSPDSFEDYRTDDTWSGGVTFMENAKPAADDATWSQDPAGGSTADSMATWFTQRPFLTDAAKVPVTVDGMHGWLLTGSVRPGARLPADKAGEAAGPTFFTLGATAAITPNLKGKYVVLDTPGAGVTVIWFWSSDGSRDALSDATTYLNHITFS